MQIKKFCYIIYIVHKLYRQIFILFLSLGPMKKYLSTLKKFPTIRSKITLVFWHLLRPDSMTRHFQPLDFMSENPSSTEQKENRLKGLSWEKRGFTNLP